MQPVDAGLRAQRLRRGKDPEQVDRSGRDGGTALGKIAGLLAGGGGRVGRWPPDRVGPVQLGDLGGRTPGEVLLARLGEQVVAGVFQAAGEIEPGRVLGDQGPVPRPLPLGGLVPGGVEGQGGGAEIPGRPRPLGLDAAAASAGSCRARPRRVRPATGSARPVRPAGRRACPRPRRGPARPGPARAAGGRRRSGRGLGAPELAASRPRCAAPGRPDRRRWRQRSHD